jgi:hypothetical protein
MKMTHFRGFESSFQRIIFLFFIVCQPLNAGAGLFLLLNANPASVRLECLFSSNLQHQEALHNHPSPTRSNSGNTWCSIIGDSITSYPWKCCENYSWNQITSPRIYFAQSEFQQGSIDSLVSSFSNRVQMIQKYWRANNSTGDFLGENNSTIWVRDRNQDSTLMERQRWWTVSQSGRRKRMEMEIDFQAIRRCYWGRIQKQVDILVESETP